MNSAPTATTSVIIIGPAAMCRRLERQLNLLTQRPTTIGWILSDESDQRACEPDDPVLGCVNQLEAILAHHMPGEPGLALITLPAQFADLVQSIRTRLRRLGVPERFVPTLEDLLNGIGPRSQFTIDPDDLLDRPPRAVDEDSVRSLLRNRRVLITGAGGSIGSELSRRVARYEPTSLILVERSENALFEIDRQIARFAPDIHRRAALHDVVDAAETRTLFEEVRPDVVFHAAAHKHVPMMEDHPAAAVDNNLFGTKSVADAALACGAQRFVLISSDKAVNPKSVMGATKRLAEMYIQHLSGTRRLPAVGNGQPRAEGRSPEADFGSCSFCIVRFGNVLGSSGSVIDTWTRQMAEGGPLTVTDRRMTRYFMTIPEAASLVIQAAALSDPAATEAEVFVLNMGAPVRIVDLAERFIRLHGLEPDWPDDEKPGNSTGLVRVAFTGIRPGEKLYEELARDTDALRPTRHPDIDIWGLPQPDPRHVESIVSGLHPAVRSADSSEIARLVLLHATDAMQLIGV